MDDRDRRVVVTGMAVNTPLGDELETYFESLMAGRSAIAAWKFFDPSGIYSKIGGDLSDYDVKAKSSALAEHLPAEVHGRLARLLVKAAFSTRLSMLCAADAYLDAGAADAFEPDRAGVILGGHNLNNHLFFRNVVQFLEEPEYIDSQLALTSLDTDNAASVGEVLGLRGATYSVGGACASTNVALRSAVDEIRHHDHELVFVVGAPLEFSPLDLQAMAIMGAISYNRFNDQPERASRPYDADREGFVPSQGAGVLVLEELGHALRRGARIYAEVLEAVQLANGCHLPSPSAEGQARAMRQLLRRSGTAPEEVDYISAHATSTPLGDVAEIASIKDVFGEHAYKLRINAPKSMLGHCCWSAPVVETVAALLQMKHGWLHPSINIDRLDPQVDLDVCANRPVEHKIRCLMKNSFGFGGINCCALFRGFDGDAA